MRRIAVILVPLVVAGLGLIALIPLTSGGFGACPLALMHGTLRAEGSGLVVASADGTETSPVRWPFGYGTGDDNGRIGLWHFFSVIAHEGDEVELVGGTGRDNVFNACGTVRVVRVSPTFEPRPFTGEPSVGPQG